jgi:phosphoribosylglycinamide formyltransferase-1
VSAASPRKRVAALISGRGSNMLSLMAAARQADYPAEIALVFSNKPDAPGLETAKDAGIATAALFHKDFASREDFERAMQDILLAHKIDLVCLAGFMRLLTPWFVEQWTGRMINIHPAILPSYKGLHTHARALADGVKLHGATVHFVVPEMDAGAIIAQAAVPVLDGDTPETLGARVLIQEHVLYPLALKLVASGAAKIIDGKVLTGETANGETLVVPSPSLQGA